MAPPNAEKRPTKTVPTDQKPASTKFVDAPEKEILRVLQLEGQAILDCAARFQQEQNQKSLRTVLDFIIDTRQAGGKVVCLGMGKSGKIAQKVAATLSSTGTLATYLHPSEALHGDLGIVRDDDCVLAFSHSGNTKEMVELLPALKRLRVPVIGIGGNPQSHLAETADVWIDASVQEEACPHQLAPTTSTTLALAIGDGIAVALMSRNQFGRKDFEKNHPSGAIGKRLSSKVHELMHALKRVPTVNPDASVEDVVVASTDGKLGAVYVLDSRKELLGIITDGDIRRAIRNRKRFFQLRAEEMMTVRPVTISPETSALEALHLMEDRKSQINVLPVVDSSGKPLGLVRLHDLVRTL